jgi:hypothetical protein
MARDKNAGVLCDRSGSKRPIPEIQAIREVQLLNNSIYDAYFVFSPAEGVPSPPPLYSTFHRVTVKMP